MARKIKISEFKTKRINQFTGGEIKDYSIPDYPKSKDDDGVLRNSFVSKSGEYIGSYEIGWIYFKNNRVVFDSYPHGVAIVLKKPANKILNFKASMINDKDIKGYRGYTHRGGQIFSIGDRLFDPKYRPKESDFSKKEWNGFIVDREKFIVKGIKEGWYKSKFEGLKELPISDLVPFKKRGRVIIKTHSDAIKAAINMSKYLS